MNTALAAFLMVLMAFAIQGCEKKAAGKNTKEEAVIKREGEPDFVKAFDDGRMDAAISEAKSSLETFITALKADAPTSENFTIKKAYSHGQGEKEFIWIGDVRLVEGVFEGKIGNEPVNDIGVSFGESVRVKPEEVEDWMFMSEGRLKGGYTVVALVYGTDEEGTYEQNMGIDWSSYEFLKVAE